MYAIDNYDENSRYASFLRIFWKTELVMKLKGDLDQLKSESLFYQNYKTLLPF
jgi:hypothetical protein